MRLFLLASLVMVAFAGNSLLNRLAVAEHAIGPMSFAAIRVATGALALAAIVAWRQGRLPLSGRYRLWGVLSLALYLIGFSLAYLRLDAGLGALVLFGGVQVTMFAAAVVAGEAVPPLRWLGATVALGGLAWLTLPGAGAAAGDGLSLALMLAAAFGWGIYSLLGRHEPAPLVATAANFVLAVPVVAAALVLLPGGLGEAVTMRGVGLAALSGAVTSGLGYALWFAVLPRLGAQPAALAQLTVPVIALAGGAVLLGEIPGVATLAAAALVLGGVALGLAAPGRVGARHMR